MSAGEEDRAMYKREQHNKAAETRGETSQPTWEEHSNRRNREISKESTIGRGSMKSKNAGTTSNEK